MHIYVWLCIVLCVYVCVYVYLCVPVCVRVGCYRLNLYFNKWTKFEYVTQCLNLTTTQGMVDEKRAVGRGRGGSEV